MRSRRELGFAVGLLPIAVSVPLASGNSLDQEFGEKILPLVEAYCLDCHSTDEKKGELDLERFANAVDVRAELEVWRKVVEQIEDGEMPPKKRKQQPDGAQKKQITDWAKAIIEAEIRASAGDPGAVGLRRLSNAEYNYAIEDLTGVVLEPAREFPEDAAAGEGFTNTAQGLAMSPAMARKYYDAAKSVAEHVVLLPDGIRFSPSTLRRDREDEILHEIREIYFRHIDRGAVDFGYKEQVRAARSGREGDIDLERYLKALVEGAAPEGLSERYIGLLAKTLEGENTGSPLLDSLRGEWKRNKNPMAMASAIRSWQNKLWKFNTVGHFGSIRPWQEPVDPVVASREFRVKIGDQGATLWLTANAVGDQDADEGVVVWKNPRIVRPGKPALRWRDLERAMKLLESRKTVLLREAGACLKAAFEVRDEKETVGLAALAKAHGVDANALSMWLSLLGIESTGEGVQIEGLLTHPLTQPTYGFVKGWGLKGVGDLSINGNQSDQAVRIPGEANPHKVFVHPRPERWVAVGWKSPADGEMRVRPWVRDAHNACGNGVRWSLRHRTPTREQRLAGGDVDLGKAAKIDQPLTVRVRRGDMISLIIDSRDRSHICDLTEIDLEIEEARDGGRKWGLATDCADSMSDGNPHADRFGNEGVWHFYSDEENLGRGQNRVPVIEEWWAAKAADSAEALVREALAKQDASFLKAVDHAVLSSFQPELDNETTADTDIVADASSAKRIHLPAALAAGAEFVVTATLAKPAGVQCRVLKEAPSEAWVVGEPILATPGSEAEKHVKQTFDEFRELFPAAMCYARIVPVDEVVTLTLFHREDDRLARLMLSDVEKARLDKLWDELIYVSEERRRLVTGYEQLWQFATQDSDPRKFEPMEEAIRARAAAYEKRLIDTEPAHLDALMEFADRAWRKPLTEGEREELHALYRSLREQELSHGESIRLVLARVLTSPEFLYKFERTPEGVASAPVSSLELASRLSFFLWSSIPDAELRNGELLRDDKLLEQTRRMMGSPKVRRMAIEFACQWLHVRGFDELDQKSERHFPEFGELRGPMYEEIIRFFEDLFRNNGSVLSMLDADHSFVGPTLATFYGLPAVSEWTRVDGLRARGRGGILGMAVTLARQSGASRTSPILRGNWVYETLLGEQLPNPPKNVPQLPDTVPEGLTERELIERHSSDPACAKCHAKIDPYGFALENYDAIGRAREGRDTQTSLPDGREIDGLDGLRTYLSVDRRDDFLRQFCRKLLGYALGRRVLLSDERLLEKMEAALEANEYRIGTAIGTIVLSQQFREIRGIREER